MTLIRVTFQLDTDTLALLDREARKQELTRSDLVRRCVRALLVSRLPLKPAERVQFTAPEVTTEPRGLPPLHVGPPLERLTTRRRATPVPDGTPTCEGR